MVRVAVIREEEPRQTGACQIGATKYKSMALERLRLTMIGMAAVVVVVVDVVVVVLVGCR